MSTIRRMPPIASILVVLCYLVFTTLAILKYPLPYSPVDNWLSDLGNTQLSPYGAQFYNLGIVVTGLLVLVFYLTILEWRLDQNRVQNIMVLLTQFFGVIGSVSMILSGYYPINLPDLHSFWSAALFVAFGTSFAFSAAALRYHRQVPRWLLAMGVLTALADMAFSVFFNGVHIWVWVTILLLLGYILALGGVTRLISTEAMTRTE